MVTAALNTTSALKDFIKKYLEKRGYKTTEGVKVLGKSGAEHTFDMLARRDAGFASHSIGVALIPDGDEKTRINFLHNCANRAYDVGLAASVIIATTPLSQEAQRLAQHQRMKIVNADEIQTLLTEEPARKIQFTGSATFETRSQLTQALENLNYRIEREVKLKGKSGMDYTFDIIAYEDDPVTGHRLVIDFLHDDVEIPLERVSLFEVKSYDVGFSDKAIAISAPMSREARQFAQKYGIQIIQIEQKPTSAAGTTPQPPSAKKQAIPVVKSTKIDDDKAPVAPAKPIKLVPEVEALEDSMSSRFRLQITR
jgi:general secretion pathway protein E